MAGERTVSVMMCMAAAALLVSLTGGAGVAAASAKELRRGFSAAHDTSYSHFQPVLSDPTGVFALGFLRVNSTTLDLAVLHLPSAFPLWRAMPDRPAPWSAAASLSFNGSLVLTDGSTNQVLWSTAAAAGDRAVLLNTSNLHIQSSGNGKGSQPSEDLRRLRMVRSSDQIGFLRSARRERYTAARVREVGATAPADRRRKLIRHDRWCLGEKRKANLVRRHLLPDHRRPMNTRFGHPCVLLRA